MRLSGRVQWVKIGMSNRTGGKGQYGHVVLEVGPLAGVERFKFNTRVKPRVIPKEFFKAIELGVKEAMEVGILAGFPVINVEVTLLDGSFHEEKFHRTGL